MNLTEYRRHLVAIASDPQTYAHWIAARPSNRIVRVGDPRFEYTKRGKSRIRRPVTR
jgi:hypothetical protein